MAELSSLALSDAEIDSMKDDFDRTISDLDQLSDIKTDNVAPTLQVTELENVWRPDDIQQQEASRADLLGLSKATVDNQVKVPKIL